jgi:hypothetical protein
VKAGTLGLLLEFQKKKKFANFFFLKKKQLQATLLNFLGSEATPLFFLKKNRSVLIERFGQISKRAQKFQ